MTITRPVFPSDFATWRHALALIVARDAGDRCHKCGNSAMVLRHDVPVWYEDEDDGKEKLAEIELFACVECAEDVLCSPHGDGFYLLTPDGYEPWENIIDDKEAE